MFNTIASFASKAWSWGMGSSTPPAKPVDTKTQNFTHSTFSAKASQPAGYLESIPLVDRAARLARHQLYSFFKGKGPGSPKEIQAALKTTGTQEIALKTESDVSVRAYSLKAEDFSKKLGDAGLKSAKISIAGKTFQAFQCPENPDFMKTLSLLSLTGKNGQWTSEKIGEETYLIPNRDYQEFDQLLSQFDATVTSVEALKPLTATHTIILSGGIFSHMDSGRMSAEFAFLALQGVNVIMLEDKNPSVLDSESKDHVAETRDALHKHLSQIPGFDSSKLVWKGTCFGAHSSVEAAAKFGGAAIIDQGFNDTVSMAVDYATKKVGRIIAQEVVPVVIRENDLDTTIDALTQVKGPVCFIANVNDQEVSNGQFDRMISKASSASVVYISDPEIKHGGAWYQDRDAFGETIDFLRKNGMCKSNLIEAQA